MPSLRHLMLATVEDSSNPRSWSGIPFSLRDALGRQVEKLTVFHPSRPSRNLVDVAKRQIYGGTPLRYPLWITEATLRQNARELQAALTENRPDALLSISSQCLVKLAPQPVPVAMFSDAPWLAWHEAYEGTTTPPMRAREFSDGEAGAARRIDAVCFGSEWAVREADRLYGVPPQRESCGVVAPLGANWVPDLSREEVLAAARARQTDALELLFVGKDWERKGGPLAVEVARLLHARGTRVTLHIVGCSPQLPAGAEAYSRVYGLLHRDNADAAATLAALYLQSTFLLVPTTAECFGIIFAEAQAFALPPVSRAVHAVPSIVADGETGILLDPSAAAEAYVVRILDVLSFPGRYQQMATAARARYESLLTWDHCAAAILSALREAAARKTSPA